MLRPAASSYRMACRRREEEEETPRQRKAREGEEAASEGVGWLGFLPGWIRGHLSRARPNGSGALPVVALRWYLENCCYVHVDVHARKGYVHGHVHYGSSAVHGEWARVDSVLVWVGRRAKY